MVKRKIALLSKFSLALSCLLTLPVALAQVVNDPSASAILPPSVIAPPSVEVAPEVPVTSKDSLKSDAKMPVLELQPELDTIQEESGKAIPDPEEPLRAKAVMVDINSNNLNYDKDRDVYIATGSVHMVISEQNSELFADKLTYDPSQSLAIAEGNVTIVKNGQKTHGAYAKIDLSRKSALINDAMTTISAVRVKAAQAFVNADYVQLENGRLIISGTAFQRLAKSGGLGNLGNSTGKGASQAKLKRAYSKKVTHNRDMVNQMSFEQQQMFKNFESMSLRDNFDESPKAVSRFNLKAKEVDVVRNEDGYDEITLKHPSLYMGKHKLLNLPQTDFSYDEPNKQVQYLGPDIGSNRGYGGAYLGPGWDFHVGPGSLRLSPMVSFGSPGFWSSNGKTGKQINAGAGLGAVAHYRDPKTAIDLAYNTQVGSPIFYGDRVLFGNTHLMAAANDFYDNGLLEQRERPTYIAQITDYRVLKDFSKFQLTSFESIGYAKDNFYPNYRENYFVESKGEDPQTLGRVQLQLQLANTAPLLTIGKHAYVGMRAQFISAAYSSGDFVGLGRIGPTLTTHFLNNRWQSSMSYMLSHSVGESPFVFDSYYGGSQNVSWNNQFKVSKYLSLGLQNSFSLKRDNARDALLVGNSVYMLVGPQDIKAQLGYDMISQRSFFGIKYYPGAYNSVVNFDKAKIYQPTNYSGKAPVNAQPTAQMIPQ